MEHKTLIGGTAYEIAGGKTLVNGTGYGIAGGKTLVNGTGYGISFGTPVGSIPAGTIVNLPENGVMVPFFLIAHNYESGLNGAGRSLFVRRDSYADIQWHTSSSNKYNTSYINSWLTGTYKNLFSADMQKAMGNTIFKITLSGGLADMGAPVFILSLHELGLNHIQSSHLQEGTPLELAAHLHVVARDGALSTQWTRTASTSNSSNAYYVQSPSYTAHVTYTGVTGSYGVRPCFTLPADYLL